VVLAESATETMASIALVAVGGGVTGAAFGRAVGYAIGAVTALLVARQVLGRGAFALRSRGEVAPGHILRYAGALMITNSAYTVYAAVDTLLIGAILTTGAVGLFSGPMRLVVFMGYVGESVAGAIAPRVAKAAGREPDAASWRGGLRWLVIFQTLLVAPLLVWATPIVRLLLGSQFLGSGPILRVLTLHVFLRGLSPVMSVTANYLGQGGRRLPIVLSALAVNAVIDVVLLPIVGPVGAAVGIGVAYLIYVPAHFRLCRQRIEVPLRPLARTLGRSALAAAAMALVLFAFGTERLSAPQWILGSLAGTLAFVAVLLATGEVRRTDLRRAVGFARARLSAA
jgi:O-antigen/teichoic acid export membrane protein